MDEVGKRSVVPTAHSGDLVDLLDLGTGGGTAGRGRATAHASHAAHVRHTAGHAARSAAHALVHLGHDRVAYALQLLLLVLVLLLRCLLVVAQPLQRRLDLLVERGLVAIVQLAGHVRVTKRVLHGVRVVLQTVLRLHALALLLVVCLVLHRVVHHALDLVLAQPALVVGNGDLVALASALLLRGHVQDAVGVQVERHLDLRHAARRRRDAGQVERAQQVAVLRHRALALEDLDVHAGLVVRVRREDLALLGRDRRVALDQRRHHATGRLNAQRQRRHIQQQQTLRLLALAARQDEGLHRSAVRDSLVGVDALVQLLAAEEVRHEGLHLRDTRRPAHQHHVVHGALVHLRVLQHALHWLDRAAKQVAAQLLEARACDGGLEVNVLEQCVDLNRRLRRGRQRALRALARRAQTAQRAVARRQALALVLALELLGEEGDEAVVEVLAAEVRVAVRGLHLEDAAVDREQRHIERAAAKVEDQHVALLAVVALVQTVRDGRRCRLVDDTQHLQTSNRASVLRRLALRVVEVRRHCHHGLLHLLAQVRLRRLLHLQQHHRADLLRREGLLLAAVLHRDHGLVVALRRHLERPVLHVGLHNRVVELAANQALGVEHGVVRVHRHLVLCGIADQALRVRERDIRRGRAVALVVRDDIHALVLPHAHARVRRAQVDANGALECHLCGSGGVFMCVCDGGGGRRFIVSRSRVQSVRGVCLCACVISLDSLSASACLESCAWFSGWEEGGRSQRAEDVVEKRYHIVETVTKKGGGVVGHTQGCTSAGAGGWESGRASEKSCRYVVDGVRRRSFDKICRGEESDKCGASNWQCARTCK
ncbi:heat-shock protein hsp70, putative [Leishmania tarentolae]|uniref:Heat-shock protein hsp70, putative n=1 Tax=Leishmania tarentolae TaxID=5689 RepID=A0A640KLV2_LEITA|nr:heat-shock protein hsp70, putative [Leishmania tarentolae]